MIRMAFYKYVILVGNLSVVFGLLCSLVSSYLQGKVMGKAGLGVAIIAPDEGSLEWKKKEALKSKADFLFYFGLGFALIGAGLNTWGLIISP